MAEPIQINKHGVRFFIHGDPMDVEVIRRMHEAMLHLQNMRAGHGPDVDDMRLEKPGRFKIRQVFGEVTIHIHVPGKKVPGPEGGIIELRKKEVETVTTYCLLVEMKSVASSYEDPPDGFAIFVPTAGHLPISGSIDDSMGAVGMRFYGYTTHMVDNTYDPPGIVGQPTWRLMWCKDENEVRTIEQVARVDQGWTAYDGNWNTEEVTAILNEYVWTYEDIPYTYRWYSVDPGPPPPSVGYTWAIDPAYSPDGEEADYHDERHLFFWIEAGDTITYHWPPNFNQLVTRAQIWNENNYLTRYIDGSHPAYDDDDTYNVYGIEAALGYDVLFPNGFAKYKRTVDYTVRYWGVIYGYSSYLGLQDRVAGEPTDFPHTDWGVNDLYATNEILTEYNRRYDWEGVYVKDRWKEMFIQGQVLWENTPDWYLSTFGRINVRTPVVDNPEYPEIDGDVREDYFNYALTAAQLEIIAGNEDLYDFEWLGSGDNRYYEDGETTVANGWFSVNAGGDEFVIRKEEVMYEYEYNNIKYQYKTDMRFEDVGIFTKKNTGIAVDEDGVISVVPEKIQPIYAYALEIEGTPSYLQYQKLVCGMVLDGKHYRTDEFLLDQDSYAVWHKYYAERNYKVPELVGAKNRDGDLIYCKPFVRVGIITTIVDGGETVTYEPE